MSKVDARYAILKSRLEHDMGHKNIRTKSKKDRHLSSMVADIEEKSNSNKWKQNNISHWRQRKAEQRKSSSKTDRGRSERSSAQVRHDDSSDNDEESHNKRSNELQNEARRIRLQELSRSKNRLSGDLRNLIGDKRSSSDDDEVIARKLREKIKEEKHKTIIWEIE